jgi:hypothetical protein
MQGNGGEGIARSRIEIASAKLFCGFFAGTGYTVPNETMSAPDSDLPLRRVLTEWRLSPPADPSFKSAVWARIEAHEQGTGWATFVRSHGAWVGGGVALALVLGAWSGRTQAHAKTAAERAAVVHSYVQSLDARTMRMP